MDPALQAIIKKGLNPNDEIQVIIRLVQKNLYPPDLRVVSQFGHIITGRALRKNIQHIYDHETVASFKAPRIFYADHCNLDNTNTYYESDMQDDLVQGDLTGKGVVIGLIDWGCDFAHHDFINADGTSRIIAIWDQGHKKNSHSPHPFEYGKLFVRDMINKALKTSTPYQQLGYHPGLTDKQGRGMHGTHVMGIAAANGSSGVKGIAPEAEIIFVHLAANDSSGEYNLGDSVRVLEAIDFIKKTAGKKPLSINLSIGKHGGPHDGSTLVEIAIDEFLEENNNTAVCQSAGNYYNTSTHCSGLVIPGEPYPIYFKTDKADVTPNEIEIWYPGKDEFEVTLSNDNFPLKKFSCTIDHSTNISFNGETVGTIYHRSDEPNNHKNHIDIFLFTHAPAGNWTIELTSKKIIDGRFDAWIERDGACRNCQSIFFNNVIKTSTTNTICNGYNTIVAGACNTTAQPYSIAPFSSSGPTVDGRIKPVILAPGVNIVSSKSSPPQQPAGMNKTVSMTGTSMASPYVTGAVALILQGQQKDTGIHTIRNILFSGCTVLPDDKADHYRSGYGFLDIAKLKRNIGKLNDLPGEYQPMIAEQDNIYRDEFDEYDYSNEGGCNCKEHKKINM